MLSGNGSMSEREYCIGGVGIMVIGLILGKLCYQCVTGKRL